MQPSALAVAVLLAAGLATPALGASPASQDQSTAFGAPGTPRFDAYPLPEGFAQAHNAGEPTIGIPWNTGHVFFQAFTKTHRAAFDDVHLDAGRPAVTWKDVSPAFTAINVDPILTADPVSGRVWAGGLDGACSVLGISDDDGATWTPTGNVCNIAQFDHESIGSGRWSATDPDSAARQAAYPRATYYCSQLSATACTTSLDGGHAWLPFTEVTGGCGGLHGHIMVSEVTGTAVVPDASCASGEGAATQLPGSGRIGFGFTTDNGKTWGSRTMPDSTTGDGFDPAMAFSYQSGWLWLAQADNLGVHVAMSKDEGRSWETLGGSTPEVQPATWLNLTTTFRDPRSSTPLVFGAFADVAAGDDDRVAVTYLATTDPHAAHPFDDCSDKSDGNIWHYYVSESFDGGQTWATTRLWEDPVQVGAIWNGGGGDPCRNLLDFADMDIDAQGRVTVGFADGCTKDCASSYFAWVNGTGDPPKGKDSRDSLGTILRQTTGKGLFAKYDVPAQFLPSTSAGESSTPKAGAPAAPFGLLVAAVAVAAVLRRRR